MHRILVPAFAALAAGIVALPPAQAQTASNAYLLGSPASTDGASRRITLTGETRWINVKEGESVRFVSGTAEFAWRFDGPTRGPFDLRLVAPAGALSQPVTVYVAPIPGRN